MDTPSTELVVDRSPAGARGLWAAWMLATALGYLITVGWLALTEPLGASADVVLGLAVAAVLLGGLIVGFPQYLVLENRLSRPGGWITATAFGWILALVGTVFVAVLLAQDVTYFESELPYLAIYGLTYGTLLGLCQGLALRRTIQGAGWWIPGSAAAWLLGACALQPFLYGPAGFKEPFGMVEMGWLAGITIAALVVGAVTGLVLVALLGWAPRKPELVSAIESGQPPAASDMTVYRIPQAGFTRSAALPLWGGLFVAVLTLFGVLVYNGRQASDARYTRLYNSTPDPRDWAPVGTQQPEYEADRDTTESLFYVGAYTSLMDLYSGPELSEMYSPGTQSVTVELFDPSDRIFLENVWCAEDATILEQNLKHYRQSISVNGQEVPYATLHSLPYQVPAGDDPQYPQGMACSSYGILARNWPEGRNHVVESFSFDQRVNDGWNTYQPGNYVFDYTVLVGRP